MARKKTTKKEKVSKRKTKIDWSAVEKEYSLGQLSNCSLAKKYGVSEGAIRKWAKKEGWQRDLKETFDKALEEAVITEAAQKSTKGTDGSTKGTDVVLSDEQVVKAAVNTTLEVIQRHRSDITKLNELADKAAENIDKIFQNKSFDDVEFMLGTGRESVLTMLQKLTAIKEKAILLERQAYSLSDKSEGDKKDMTVKLVNYADADDTL
jgi:hypothetical protein